MADTASHPGQEPGFFKTLGDDVRHTWSEVRRTGLKASIEHTFADLQAFYLSTERIDRLAGMGRVKRWLYLSLWLLKSLFMKLTPARRVLLVIAFLFLSTGLGWVSYGDNVRIDIRMPLLGVVLLLVILMLELKDKLLAHEELEAGRAVQHALMPDRSPSVPGWDVWLYTQSANEVGGDLVDYLRLDANRVGITLGDVAGKGLPAALLMAKLQATLRALTTEVESLSELGTRVNRILYRDGLPNRFATLVYLELSSDSGHIRVLNGGHMPPLLLRGVTVEEMPRGSFALGLLKDATFTEQYVDLDADNLLIVYSDGLTEAMNAAGDFFGEERLRALVPPLARQSAEQVGERLLAAVEQFVGDAPRHDDLSLVVLKRRADRSG
jgi:sigma-B regulation protein RsbU (phosphoserine phosphatase)